MAEKINWIFLGMSIDYYGETSPTTGLVQQRRSRLASVYRYDRFVRIDGSTACTMPLSQTAGSQAMVRDGSPLHKMKTFKDGHLSR
jgi:hypothetical protein